MTAVIRCMPKRQITALYGRKRYKTVVYVAIYGHLRPFTIVSGRRNVRPGYATYSYTVQEVKSTDGRLLGKLLLILQEKENQFVQKVQKILIVLSNIIVRTSKSEKSSDEKHHVF
ncbi:unnamed protein product [Rotaria magnacalcarata]|uniref:Uncharacterized protein n=1 Tax=Rotaria magnacalcarata TaxID=392030 RepID=A0A819ZL19_9BILA|nr:unnamed protein product [Rotaria magnacalcarata]